MADHESKHESLLHRVKDKFHDHKSSSSDSDDDHKVYRIFGREKPVLKVLGGGQLADILLWRNKKASAIVLGGATVFWFLFEFMGYHLITLVCHILIVSLATLFLWSNAHVFINKSPPQIPDAAIPEKCVLQLASALTSEINQALVVLRETASGKNLLKFLGVIAGLWVLSAIGNWCNFLTLVYICILLVFVLPFLYEKFDDRVDAYAEKAMIEIKKQYAVLEANVLSKISVGALKKD